MLVNAYARAGLVVLLAMLLPVLGCRSHTDRIRVLEAEKADAERKTRDLQHQQADMRAAMVKAEGEAESERARVEALEAKLELARRQPAPGAETTVDVSALRRAFAGTSAVVTEREGGGATIMLPSDITFHAGRADLNAQAEKTLDRVARTLKEFQGFERLRIEGHTDSDPIKKSGWNSNEELSLARASTVRQFLVARGVDETSLEVEGHGPKKPVASNTTPDGKARNRRVEIILLTRN